MPRRDPFSTFFALYPRNGGVHARRTVTRSRMTCPLCQFPGLDENFTLFIQIETAATVPPRDSRRYTSTQGNAHHDDRGSRWRRFALCWEFER